jgi:hypothetical protein
MPRRGRHAVPVTVSAAVAALGIAALAALYAFSPAPPESTFAARLTADSRLRSLGALVALVASVWGVSGVVNVYFARR